MTESEIIESINDGALFYLDFFADAEHMKLVDTGYYRYIQPKENYHGIKFVYNIEIDNLSEKEKNNKIDEIKGLNMPIWWNMPVPDDLYKMIHGKNKLKGTIDDEELYMAIFPNERKVFEINTPEIEIKKVDSHEVFKQWTEIANNNLANGYQDIHSKYHYKWCEKGLIECYICYKNGFAASIASIMNNSGVASLEFVTTVPEYRNIGLARIVCNYAVNKAFDKGVKIITNRSINEYATKVYKSIGFNIYNHLI